MERRNQGFFWQGEFHVPVTPFAKDVEVVIDPGGKITEADSANNTYRLSIPGTQR